jgi:hypothetical protein
MSKPPLVLIEAAEQMIKDCMEQIDSDLADSTLDLAAPTHPLDVWGEGKGEQVVFMTGRLNGLDRFDAICVFTLGKPGSVTIKFKSGRHQGKRCFIPMCTRRPHLETGFEIRWDDEAT